MRDVVRGIVFDQTVDEAGYVFQVFCEGWVSPTAFDELVRLYAMDWAGSLFEALQHGDGPVLARKRWLRRAPLSDYRESEEIEAVFEWYLQEVEDKPRNHLSLGWFRGMVLDC